MKKKNFHLGTADFVISAFIIGVIVILFNVFMLPDSNIDFFTEKDINMVVSISDIEEDDFKLINDNDVFHNRNKSKRIGTVKSVSDVKKVTIECKAVEENGKFVINGIKYSISDEFGFYVKNYAGRCKIEAFEVME